MGAVSPHVLYRTNVHLLANALVPGISSSIYSFDKSIKVNDPMFPLGYFHFPICQDSAVALQASWL